MKITNDAFLLQERCPQIGGYFLDAFVWLLFGRHFQLVDANTLVTSSPTMCH